MTKNNSNYLFYYFPVFFEHTFEPLRFLRSSIILGKTILFNITNIKHLYNENNSIKLKFVLLTYTHGIIH